jgi:hypothetical protein
VTALFAGPWHQLQTGISVTFFTNRRRYKRLQHNSTQINDHGLLDG